jgi:hypothetical protein
VTFFIKLSSKLRKLNLVSIVLVIFTDSLSLRGGGEIRKPPPLPQIVLRWVTGLKLAMVFSECLRDSSYRELFHTCVQGHSRIRSCLIGADGFVLRDKMITTPPVTISQP